MYLAEFTFVGTAELANDLLIQAPSELAARGFAETYALRWGMHVFSITLVNERQAQQYQRIGKSVVLNIDPS